MNNTEHGNRKTQVLNGLVLLTEAVKKDEIYNIKARYEYLGTKIRILLEILEGGRKLSKREIDEINLTYEKHEDTEDLFILQLLTLLDLENPVSKDLNIARTLQVYETQK